MVLDDSFQPLGNLARKIAPRRKHFYGLPGHSVGKAFADHRVSRPSHQCRAAVTQQFRTIPPICGKPGRAYVDRHHLSAAGH
jgi:hypothetical protein